MAQSVFCLVCGGTACESSDSDTIYKNIKTQLAGRGFEESVQVVKTGCFGFCEQGPIVKVLPDESFYVQVTPEDTEEIVDEHLVKGREVQRLAYKEPGAETISRGHQISFYQKQVRVVLRNCGFIDPESIDEYIGRGGYEALGRVLSDMSADEVLAELETAGLRGRGGAGFPTHKKWRFTKAATDTQKYVVCNADEGDPGAYMDRSILEGDPHSVLEAMAIAGYTVGADQGYIYIRAEYPLAIERLQMAIRDAEAIGLLGDNIFDSGFSFRVELRYGAGAFVCGEETALLKSIEGDRGTPVQRPPYPAVKGLWGKPTVINNVETLAGIPVIITKGGEWYARLGSETSPGTKVFALTGKINNSGLIEVPMGMTLRDIVFNIGGGIPDGKAFKAVQTGGPSGGMITEEYLDTPIDFETLQGLGSMMGSGGMIVMDEDDSMIDVAKFYLSFNVDESCGKCVPCRIGGRQIQKLLERFSKGQGRPEDIERIETIGNWMKQGSLCGLGTTAPNPALSSITHFRHEYEASMSTGAAEEGAGGEQAAKNEAPAG
ncbi:MAG: NADH-ubiquinone oxidoreductase-F iron-sulfur binding region domain-containing protein [Spirochaetota bacterium]